MEAGSFTGYIALEFVLENEEEISRGESVFRARGQTL